MKPIQIHLLILLSTSLHAIAADVPLSSVGDYVRRHNPSLAAARYRIEEARGRLTQTGRRSNPEIEFDFQHMPDFREGAVGVSLMQKFPLTNRLSLEKAVGSAELAAAESEVRDEERKLIGAAEVAAVKFVALNSHRALREKQLANSRASAEITTKRAAAGEASTVDAAQLQLESQQLVTELLLLDSERATLLGELRPLLGIRAGGALSITGSLPAPAALPSARPDVSRRADVVAAGHAAEAARQSADLARANKWEDFGVGLMAERSRSMDAPEGLTLETMIGVKFSFALPFWNKNEGRIAETTAALQRATKEIEARKIAASGEASGARGEMAALAKVIGELDTNLIPKARAIEEQLRQFYAAGQGTLPDILRATERRIAIESRRVDALRDYHIARVRHHAATGRNIRRAAK